MTKSAALRPTISPEDPRGSEASALVEALDRHLTARYRPEHRHLLDVETLSRPDVMFFVARLAGRAIGCAALRIDGEGYGELKRMFVVPDLRGQGIARALLDEIERQAKDLDLPLIRLETGILQHEAIALYAASGYRSCGPFGEYCDNGVSLFFEKTIAALRSAASGLRL